jgi:hypothetical protein
MSYEYHGTTGLITLPTRSVQTYPSGLVRVERVYACRKNQAATFRKTVDVGLPLPNDDGSPAIDGLFIFPNAIEVLREDGFIEFRVTAYGRTNLTGQRIARLPVRRQLEFTAFFSRPNPNYNPLSANSRPDIEEFLESNIIVDASDVSYKFTIPSTDRWKTPDDISQIGGVFLADTDIDLFSQGFSPADIFRVLNRSTRPSSTDKFSAELAIQSIGFQRNNFGKFDEVSVIYRLDVLPISFGLFIDASSPPSSPRLVSIIPTGTGAAINLSIPPGSTGVRIVIGNNTVTVPWGGASAPGSPFSVGFFAESANFTNMIISGLPSGILGTAYSAQIAAFNENGFSNSVTAQFFVRPLSISAAQ